MARYVDVVENAKMVRTALKAAFPGVKFSVRSDRYSGGSSIDVSWTDGPTVKAVEAVTCRFRGSSFNGMDDSTTHFSTLLAGPDGAVEEVSFAAHFIPGHRELSQGYLDELVPVAEAILREPLDLNRWYDGIACEHGVFQTGNGHALLWWLSMHVAPSTYAVA